MRVTQATIGHAWDIHVLQRRWEDGNADPGSNEGKRCHNVGRLLFAGAEACCATRGNDISAHRCQCLRLAVDNERLAGKCVKRKDSLGLGAGECMALWQSHDHWFLQEEMEDDCLQ